MTFRLIERTHDHRVLLGVVHLPPLPGSPRYDGSALSEISGRARSDAEALVKAGFDGLVLENFGDFPFFRGPVPPYVLTIMTRIATELPRGDTLLGVNVLRNDALGALSVAAAAGLDFIRVNVHTGASVTDQGIIQGDAATTLRERQRLRADVAILADVDVKHAAPLAASSLTAVATDTAFRGLADGLIVTGRATGCDTDLDDLRTVREAVGDRFPVFVGSGATAKSAPEILATASGIIVGTAVKRGGETTAPVDPRRAADFVRAARG